jgi:hypothetical protein
MDKAITILFLSANPASTQRLELINECNKIEEEIRYAAGSDKFNFKQHHDISLEDLRKQILLHNPQIIHFSGHGSEESELIFKDKSGEVQTVPQGALSEFFEILGKDISLVFLNACFSEEQAKAISKHVDFVIGMSRAISDEAAIKFAVSFYSSFGFGKSVEDSFKLAKVDLKFEAIPEEVTPRLLVKEGVDTKTVIENDPKIIEKPPGICVHLETFNQQLDKAVFNEISINQFFEQIYGELSKFLRDPQTKMKFGQPRISSLNMLLINLGTTINEIQDSENMGDKQEVKVKTNSAKSIARQIIDNLTSICSESNSLN